MHGFPHACISLGLIYKRKPVLGVIYNPFLDLLYTGVKDQGAYLIRKEGKLKHKLPLAKPKPLPSLSKALLGKHPSSSHSTSVTDSEMGWGV